MPDGSQLKIINPARPGTGNLLVFWLFVFALPAVCCRFFLNVYIEADHGKAMLTASQALREELESFRQDLSLETLLSNGIEQAIVWLRTSELPAAAGESPESLSQYFSASIARNCGIQPIFCGIMRLSDRKTGSSAIDSSPVNPGRKSFEIIMQHLFPDPARPDKGADKLFPAIAKTVFGNYLTPAERPGVFASGFFCKNDTDRMLIYHNRFQNRTDGINYAFMLVFSENSLAPQQLFDFARKRAEENSRRSYAVLKVVPERDFFMTADGRLACVAPVDPAALRIGSHKGQSWYDRSIRSGMAAQKPSRLPYLLVTTDFRGSVLKIHLPQISLALLLFAFFGLALVRQYLTGKLPPAPLLQRFKAAILAATLLPFAAFILTSLEFIAHFNRVTISAQTQNLISDLQMLEFSILNHDLQERRANSLFVKHLRERRMQSREVIEQLLKSQIGKLYEGYGFLRSDGLFLENLPDTTGISVDDVNKFRMAQEISFGQLYNIFDFAGVLHPEFSERLENKTNLVKWKAYSVHMNEIDRDSFCCTDGQYFMSRNADKNYFRLSFHHLFPEFDKRELWAGVTFIKNARSTVENYLATQNQHGIFFNSRDQMLFQSAVFRCQENSSEIDQSVAWPASALREKDMIEAARKLDNNEKETSWVAKDRNGIISIFAVRAMAELPFIIVSKCLISTLAINEQLFRVAGLLLIPYAMLLLALLSSLLAEIFLKPINLLIEGSYQLEQGRFPKIDFRSENELGTLVEHFNTMSEGMKQRQKLQRFVSEEVSDSIILEATTMQQSSGTLVYRVVVFIHIRDFAGMCEKIEPESAILLLNRYFSAFEPCLKTGRGQIEKYIGDAIMVSFSPENCDNSPAAAACAATLACLAALPQLNKDLSDAGLPEIRIGIGIAAGSVIRGKIGARQSRKDFTLIGDPVNLAARLEANSHFDRQSHILLDNETAQAVKTTFITCPHGNLAIKGKSQPVSVFELKGVAP